MGIWAWWASLLLKHVISGFVMLMHFADCNRKYKNLLHVLVLVLSIKIFVFF